MTRDPLDDLGSRDRGLIELFNHLTSEPSADELSGEYAALTMFRAAQRAEGSAAGGAHAASRRPARRRLVARARVGGRLVAAATVAVLAGGFAAAGYADVLPSPLQHLANQVLEFAGVHSSRGKPGSSKPTAPVTSSPTTPGSAGPGRSQPGSTSPSPHRSSSSSPSSIRPAIRVTVVRGPHGRSETLVVSIPRAQPGDVVRLEDLVGGQWQLVRMHRLHQGGHTEFSVVPRKISVTYRVVLPATVKHGQSVSGQVPVVARPNARPKKGGPGGG